MTLVSRTFATDSAVSFLALSTLARAWLLAASSSASASASNSAETFSSVSLAALLSFLRLPVSP